MQLQVPNLLIHPLVNFEYETKHWMCNFIQMVDSGRFFL